MEVEAIPLVLPSRIRIVKDEKTPKWFLDLLLDLKYKTTRKKLAIEDDTKVDVVEYSRGKDLSLVVNPSAKLFLDTITEPFGIISITGPLRSGKSTFLSHVVNHLREKTTSSQEPHIQNFEVSNKTRCCTVGIWLWPQLLTLKNDGGNENCRKVVLMDVEGLYGIDAVNGKSLYEEDYFLKLFSITSFFSSVVLFNRTINLSFGANDFQELQKLSAAMVALGDKAALLLENKPHFVYLARNYNESKSFKDDATYWKSTLSNYRTPDEFRQFFLMKFSHNSYVTFVDMAPSSIDHHRDLDRFSLKELNPEFTTKFLWFMDTHLPEIMTNLCIKSPENPEEEVCVSGNFYDIVVQLVEGISEQKKRLDMDTIMRYAREGEAHREFNKRIKDLLETISSIPLPDNWKDKIYPSIESLILENATELNKYLEEYGSLETRFSPEQWIEHALVKKKIAEVNEINCKMISEKLSRYWNQQKEEAYQKLIPDTQDQWFQVILKPEDEPLKSIILPEIINRMQEFHNQKTKEALDLESDTFVIMYTTVLNSSINGNTIPNIPKTVEGCLSQIQTEMKYETLAQILALLKSSPTPTSLWQPAVEHYFNKKAAIHMSPLHSKQVDYLSRFLEDLKKCVIDRITQMKKDLIDKVSNTLLCPHIIPVFTFKDKYDPDYHNFLEYLRDIVRNTPHLKPFAIRRILNEKEESICQSYSSEKVQPISHEDLKKFIKLIVDTVTGEIPSLSQQLRIVWFQANENWREWFSHSNYKIIREIPVGSRESGDREYILTLDSPETVQHALNPKQCPPKSMKLERVKSYHVIVTHASQLDSKKIDFIVKAMQGMAISEPRFQDDLCLLDFASKNEKSSLLSQGEITFGKSNHRFIDTKKMYCSENDLILWEKYLISKKMIGDKIKGEFWPIDQIKSTSDSDSKNDSPVETRGPRLSQSEFIPPPLVSVIPASYFTSTRHSINELSPVYSELGTYIWDPIRCRDSIKNGKEVSGDELWKDPYLCSVRILVAATSMAACKFLQYTIVPKESLMLEDQNQPYAQLASKGIIQETVTVRIPSEIGPTTTVKLRPITTPHLSKSTRVNFYEKDTLACAEELLSDTTTGRLLVLNMANEHQPGGGWMTGKIAQEEELFRRSNISKTLTREFYPIQDYSALYSQNVTTFRGVEEDGYKFLEKPFTVDILSLCAYDANNYSEGGHQNVKITTTYMNKIRLRQKVVVKTYRKLVTLFHFAIQEGYQTILLGALGCGAFKNPPTDIAGIFHEVISHYAGFIPHVVFSILGYVNYNEFNQVIQKEYPAMMEKPLTPEIFVDVCVYGGNCRELEDENHSKKFFHPPVCPEGKDCPHITDRIHSSCNYHPQKCQRAASCPKLFDENHKRMTIHPEKCPLGVDCKSTEENHFMNEWHPPTCEKGLACPEYINPNVEHLTQYRHQAKPCPNGLGCREYHDLNHVHIYWHPFLPLCPKYLRCSDNSQQHRSTCSHLCEWGNACPEIGNESHVLQWYHFINHSCPDGSKCTLTDELHLNTYSHPNIRDIRPLCKDGTKCPQRMVIEHVKSHSHPLPDFTAVCPINPLIMDQYNPNNPTSVDDNLQLRIPFWENTRKMLERFVKFRTSKKIDLDIHSPQFQSIVDWFRDLRPVHRLNKEAFVSVLKTGAFLSIHQLRSLSQREENIVPIVVSHPLVVPILKKDIKLQDNIINFIRRTIRLSLLEEKEKKQKSDPSKVTALVDPNEVKEARQLSHQERKILETGMKGEDVEIVATISKELSLSAANIQFTGIGYPVDARVGTDKTVFSVMGPHTGNYGNIHVVFQNVLKWHPNFYCLPCAATFFFSKNYHCQESRTWVTVEPWDAGGKNELDASKMHPICADMAVVLALEYIGRAATRNNQPWSNIRLKDVQNFYQSIDSHQCIEGHLPYQVPLSYVHQVVMSKEIWNSFNQAEKIMAEQLLGENFIFTNGHPESFEETKRVASLKELDIHLGYSFILPPPRIKGDEVFVPLKLASSACRTIYFEALGGDFIVCLCNQERLDPPRISFSVCFLRNECTISDEAPIKASLMNDGKLLVPPGIKFNQNLDKMKPIHYYISYDRSVNKMVVGHWGPSEVYCTAPPLTYVSTKPLPDLRFFSISIFGTQKVAFNHVHFTTEPHKSALQSDSRTALKVSNNRRKLNNNSDPSQNRAVLGLVSEDISSSLSKYSSWTDSRKLCENDKKCTLCYIKVNSKHIEEYSHSCLHGSSCTKHDRLHRHQFTHVGLPKCPKDHNCTEKQDPQHRGMFAHSGLWDFMLPCKNGASCQNCDKTKYYH